MSLSRDTSEAHWIEDICVNWEAGCQRWWRCSCICCVIFRQVLRSLRGFPGGSVVKNPSPMQETQETWVNPWVRKIPWWKKWQPDPVFLPEKPYGERSLVNYSPWHCKELEPTNSHTHTHVCVCVCVLYIYIYMCVCIYIIYTSSSFLFSISVCPELLGSRTVSF